MSGQAQRQVLSLTLMWVPCLAPLRAAGVTQPAVMIRGAVSGNGSGASLNRPRLAQPTLSGAASLSQRKFLERSLITSFPATKDFRLHPARFRGRVGWDGPGTSSSRFVRAQWLSLPLSRRTAAAGDLTDLLPPRPTVGGGSPGYLKSKDAPEAKSRMSGRTPHWHP